MKILMRMMKVGSSKEMNERVPNLLNKAKVFDSVISQELEVMVIPVLRASW